MIFERGAYFSVAKNNQGAGIFIFKESDKSYCVIIGRVFLGGKIYLIWRNRMIKKFHCFMVLFLVIFAIAGCNKGRIIDPASATASPSASASASASAASLSITSFSPLSAVVGAKVTITGTNFSTTAADDLVAFNGTAATITETPTATKLVVTVPSGVTTGPITVTVGGVTVTSSQNFTLAAATDPTIISFTPLSGVVGATVTITGTNFSTTAANNTVAFNGTAATVTGTPTSDTIVTSVPTGATTGPITVTVGGVTATSAANFIVGSSWTAATYTFDGSLWTSNTASLLTTTPIAATKYDFTNMTSPISASDGLIYFSETVTYSSSSPCLQYRYSLAATGSQIVWTRSSYAAALPAVGTDMGADVSSSTSASGTGGSSNALFAGYVALNIPTDVIQGTVTVSFTNTTASQTGNVAIIGSKGTAGSATKNVILATTGTKAWTAVTTETLSTGSISLTDYTHIKIIYSREVSAVVGSGGINLNSITVAP